MFERLCTQTYECDENDGGEDDDGNDGDVGDDGDGDGW